MSHPGHGTGGGGGEKDVGEGEGPQLSRWVRQWHFSLLARLKMFWNFCARVEIVSFAQNQKLLISVKKYIGDLTSEQVF